MKPGQTIESAAWVTGEETPEQIAKYKTRVEEAIDALCAEHGMMHGPVQFIERKPGEDRVPEVPDHIQGQDVRLIGGEALVLGRKPDLRLKSFLNDLDPKDLGRLREITRRAAVKHGQSLSTPEVDGMIEELGPEAALSTLRSAVDGGTLH